MVKKLDFVINYKRVKKGEQLKAFRYASTAALCNDYVTIYNIIPNTYPNRHFYIKNLFSYITIIPIYYSLVICHLYIYLVL